MKWTIWVKANAKTEKVEQTAESTLKVFVKAPAKEGRANEAVIEALGNYFKRPRSHFRILSGRSSKHKIIEIL